MSAFDLERLFVRQVAPPRVLLRDRFSNSFDALGAVVPISREDAPPFSLFDVLSVDRFNQLFPFDELSDSGDAVEPIKRTRKRKPTLAGVARQATKAGIEVAGYEVRPDGTIKVITGKPSETTPDNNDKDSNEWDGVLPQ